MAIQGFDIDDGLTRLAESCEAEIAGGFAKLDRICAHNQAKTLAAFRKNRVS
jgi:cystathionine beta-lyase family protein involved in aluminum resistance